MTKYSFSPPSNNPHAEDAAKVNRLRMAAKFADLGFRDPDMEATRAEIYLAEMLRQQQEQFAWRPMPEDLPADFEYLVKTNGFPTYAIAVKHRRRRWPWSEPKDVWYFQGGCKPLTADPIYYRPLGSLL